MAHSGLDPRHLWVAHSGLDPRHHRSGTSVEWTPRLSQLGNRRLRRALYMPALVAVRHDPHLRGFYQRLCANGKAPLQALVAVMRNFCTRFIPCSGSTSLTTEIVSVLASRSQRSRERKERGSPHPLLREKYLEIQERVLSQVTDWE
jgi:hypothetical protein